MPMERCNNLGLDRYTKGAGCRRAMRKTEAFLGVSWKAVIRGLMIARQEAVAVPVWRRPVYEPAQLVRLAGIVIGR